MATLPRSARNPSGSGLISQRPVSDFDAGLNTSAAWTEHLECGATPAPSLSKAHSKRFLSESNVPRSLSDDEVSDDAEEITRPARALYSFEGKAEFRELTVEAGDELEVVKEDVGEGWSLVRDCTGEIGLLPQRYYTLTQDFVPSPDLQLDVVPQTKRREASSSSITPRGSPRSSQSPLIPQSTGEWLPYFPSFRQSLLGGKSLNRFSSFVTSGAEAFLLKGSPSPEPPPDPKPTGHAREDTTASMAEAAEEERLKLGLLGLGEADRHFIDSGAAGPSWRAKTPSFSVLVHSPSKRTSGLSGAYTMYSVTSIFPSSPPSATTADWVEVPDPDGVHPPSPTDPNGDIDGEQTTRVTVQRRFSHFVMLHTVLSRRLPGIALPPLPEKQYAGRFSQDFVEARRGDLERYLNKVVRHPVLRYAEVVTFFLGCESDSEWSRLLPKHLSAPAAGPAFYARVYHPAFNVDLEDADDAIYSFQTHARAVGKGVQGLRSVFGRVREARIEMSKAERLLSYSLLSLITSKPLAAAPATGATSDEEGDTPSPYEKVRDKQKGLMNKDGAWCWREGCSECLKLSKAVQKTCETLQTVANLYDSHSVITTHKSTLTRYREAIGGNSPAGLPYADGDVAGRCETVLNTTMAEIDVYHGQKVADLKTVAVDHLDGEIAFYQQILTRLKAARATYDDPQYADLGRSPRLPSIYERDLSFDPSNPGHSATNPNLNPQPLPQPCPHVYDSAPMRPVSVAIQEGVGMFLGDGSGKSGLFGKFW
ncbi:hypothetical protein NLJ89_g1092 [Agrocybe chaxingu]|uniref:PX-domain-containing protein n=1 Tax=Agrocybe chaxingu TaxID=84603 RepID=A0A9W8TE11_9AGAR|nr:hypothetical protein NLJ89_g1092 [Agrocybe chaxingu]